MRFASDNTSGVCPEILDAVTAAASGYAAAYGADDETVSLDARFSEVFEREVRVFPVISGTAANCLALAGLTPPYGLMFCHRDAHVFVDEAGAPEFFAQGARLVPLSGDEGKIDPAALSEAVSRPGHGVHSPHPSVLTVTQATEAGTVYSLDELGALVQIARARDMSIHMDGARFANAVVSSGCSPAEATWRAGVEVLSFGATKNGAMGAEAIVYFDPEQVGEVERRRKRAGHLISKMRYVAVQLLAYLADDLWRRNARHANEMATRLSDGLVALPGVEAAVQTQANEVFVRLPPTVRDGLAAAGAEFYVEQVAGGEAVRLVTSFSTTDADVGDLLDLAARLTER